MNPSIIDTHIADIDGDPCGVVRRVQTPRDTFWNAINRAGHTVALRLPTFEDAEDAVLAAYYGGSN